MLTIRYNTFDATNRFVADSVVVQCGGELEKDPPSAFGFHDVELFDLDHLPPEGAAVKMTILPTPPTVLTAVHSYQLDKYPIDDLLNAGISVYRTLDDALEAWLPGARASGGRVKAEDLANDEIDVSY